MIAKMIGRIKFDVILIFFLLLFVALIISCHQGISNYWDWYFPYYENQLKNIFFSESLSWTNLDMGRPYTYASNFYMRIGFLLVSYIKIPPEYILNFIILIASFIVIHKIYLLSHDGNRAVWPAFFSLLAVFNSAVFYKLLSGHFYYLISFAIFVLMIEFIVKKFKNNIHDYLMLGLLLAFVGFQIQFFVFAIIVIFVFFIFNRDKFNLRYFFLAIPIAFFVNLPWLSNFLFGANSVSATSQGATEMLFPASVFASPLRIFTMAFSNATNIQYVYGRYWLAYFGIFSMLIIVSMLYYLFIVRKDKEPVKQKDKNTLFFISSWIVFLVLGTGYFQNLPIPLIKRFYPMFRESGHFAPVIVLFGILVFAHTWPYLQEKIVALLNSHFAKNQKLHCSIETMQYTKPYKIISYGLALYLVGFVSVNAYYIAKYLPRVDYANVREKFQQFEDFGQTNESKYRVLAYPFWSQYGFLGVENIYKNGKLLNNSGWDSYIGFSGKDYISNYHPGGQSLHDTLQYRLLRTFDISDLEKKNVKYIYDFSGIYESNFERYTPPETYDYDIGFIKNDPRLFDKLMEANPGKIEKVGDRVYELKNTKPRIYLEPSNNQDTNNNNQLNTQNSANPNEPANLYFQKINPTKYKISIRGLKDRADLNFLESFHKDWKLYVEGVNDMQSADGPQWCEQAQEQNNNAVECLAKQRFTEWNELKYLNAKPIADRSHTKFEGYGNSWTISKEEILRFAQNDKGANIKTNSDGSIDVELVMYFQPQTPFYIALILSLLTIFGTSGFLIYAKLRKKKWKKVA